MSKGKGRIEAAVFRGGRDYQQDAVARLVSADGKCMVGILSDGIGGHGFGHIASRVAVRECVSKLEGAIDGIAAEHEMLPTLLADVASAANERIAGEIATFPETSGMGATLLLAAIVDGHLYWCSVGDSHLRVCGKGAFKRVNADHSLADGLQNLVKVGIMDERAAAGSRQRSALTSAVSGEPIAKLDCPAAGLRLAKGDIVVLASDGIETLDDREFAGLRRDGGDASPEAFCDRAISAIRTDMSEDQDNVSLVVAFP